MYNSYFINKDNIHVLCWMNDMKYNVQIGMQIIIMKWDVIAWCLGKSSQLKDELLIKILTTRCIHVYGNG